MVVKVYGPIRAACPQRVIVCLLEMGVDFELVPVDLESGEHKKPEFLLRQPFGQVPAIEEGDFRLFVARGGSPQLQRHGLQLGPPAGGPPANGERSDLALVRNCENKLEKVLDIYEQRLSKSNYLAGDSFTLADLSHLPGLRYLMDEAGLGHMVRNRKNVNSWWMEISSRPAWKKVMKLMD
ncbi:hypothetical protein C3L33_01806, partial [Rhododendron williamsianum]